MLRTSVVFIDFGLHRAQHFICVAPLCSRHRSHCCTCAGSCTVSGITREKLSFHLWLLAENTVFWATWLCCHCPLFLWLGAGLAQSHSTGTKQAQGETIPESCWAQSHPAGLQMHKMGSNDLKKQVHVFIKAYCSSELNPKLFNHFIFKNAASHSCSK